LQLNFHPRGEQAVVFLFHHGIALTTSLFKRFAVQNGDATALVVNESRSVQVSGRLLEHIDAGWQLGEFSSRTGFFFCDKAGERRMVEISMSNPGSSATPESALEWTEHGRYGLVLRATG
jgi:hypothetical protein